MSVTIPAALTNVANLIRTGNFPAAREQFRATLDYADPADRDLIVRCARILQSSSPTVGVAKLRQLWQQADDARARAIITACAPKPGEQRRRPQPQPDHAPRRNSQNKHQAPIQTRQQAPDRNRPRPKAGRYVATTQGADDDRTRPQPITSNKDDHARDALTPLRGRACVALGCNLERTPADDERHGDWLCSECRELDRPGIDPMPANHTRAQAIQRLCAYARVNYPQAIESIRNLWRRSTQEDRRTITAWIAAKAPADEPAPKRPACGQCGGIRQIRHGLCCDCRKLDDEPTLTVAPTTTDNETTAAPVDDEEPTMADLAAVDAANYYGVVEVTVPDADQARAAAELADLAAAELPLKGRYVTELAAAELVPAA